MTDDGDTGTITDYGFTWGPAEVTRMMYVPGRGRVIEIRTNHASLQIGISEKGRRIRVWLDHIELVPIDGTAT